MSIVSSAWVYRENLWCIIACREPKMVENHWYTLCKHDFSKILHISVGLSHRDAINCLKYLPRCFQRRSNTVRVFALLWRDRSHRRNGYSIRIHGNENIINTKPVVTPSQHEVVIKHGLHYYYAARSCLTCHMAEVKSIKHFRSRRFSWNI